MANRNETPTPVAPFARLPGRRGLAAGAVVALWVSLCGAFAAEILPVGSPADRLYELEAARDRFTREALARAAVAARDAEPRSPVAGRAAHPRRRTSQSTSVRTIDTTIDVASGM